MNLAFHSSPAFVDRLMAYVRKRNMRQSAISLDALQSDAVKLGWAPRSTKSSTKWASILATTEDSLILAAERLIKDFEDMPPGMRRKRGEEDMTKLVMQCNLLTWCLQKCRADVVADDSAKMEAM